MSNLLSDSKWLLIGASALVPLALYLRKCAARSMEPEGGATVRFGDSQRGQMPRLGGRFRASYRVGSGRAGNVGAHPHRPSLSRLRNVLAEAEARAESADEDSSSSKGELRALLETIEPELDKLQEDIDDLYDDWFVETAEPSLRYLWLFAAVVGAGSLGIAVYVRCRAASQRTQS